MSQIVHTDGKNKICVLLKITEAKTASQITQPSMGLMHSNGCVICDAVFILLFRTGVEHTFSHFYDLPYCHCTFFIDVVECGRTPRTKLYSVING